MIFCELAQPALLIMLTSIYFDVLAKRFVGVEKLEICINRYSRPDVFGKINHL